MTEEPNASPNGAGYSVDDPRHPWSVLPERDKVYLRNSEDFLRQIMKEQPSIDPVLAHIVAGDLASAVARRDDLEAGRMGPLQAAHLTGSFSRFGFAVDLWHEGLLPQEEFFENIAELWCSADPDDGNPEFLAAWQAAYRAHGSYIRDARALPRGATFRVFRGGSPVVQPGIAWTLDPKIARKFALGAAVRRRTPRGDIAEGTVHRKNVLAYITERGESEVIVAPDRVLNIVIRRVEAE